MFWQKAVEGSLNAERFEFPADGKANQVRLNKSELSNHEGCTIDQSAPLPYWSISYY
jgi:hypothetical protein